MLGAQHQKKSTCRGGMNMVSQRLVALLLSLAAANAFAQAGYSAERLQRIDQLIDSTMAAGEISGGVTLVARNGRIVHLSARGVMDVTTKQPMQKYSIFRNASMWKHVAAVAILMLETPGQARTEQFETAVMQALVE
jgi:CubicO group peptidase (beta-lactamase class C family)